MIFDRTKEDVSLALKIRDNKIKKFISLTEEETEIIEKGFLTLSTINRIEAKQAVLVDIFHDMGYYDIGKKSDSKVDWKITDIFRKNDLTRIFEKNDILKEGFFELSFFPQSVNVGTNYEDVNALEKTLHDLEVTADSVKSLYRRCGKEVAKT